MLMFGRVLDHALIIRKDEILKKKRNSLECFSRDSLLCKRLHFIPDHLLLTGNM